MRRRIRRGPGPPDRSARHDLHDDPDDIHLRQFESSEQTVTGTDGTLGRDDGHTAGRDVHQPRTGYSWSPVIRTSNRRPGRPSTRMRGAARRSCRSTLVGRSHSAAVAALGSRTTLAHAYDSSLDLIGDPDPRTRIRDVRQRLGVPVEPDRRSRPRHPGTRNARACAPGPPRSSRSPPRSRQSSRWGITYVASAGSVSVGWVTAASGGGGRGAAPGAYIVFGPVRLKRNPELAQT